MRAEFQVKHHKQGGQPAKVRSKSGRRDEVQKRSKVHVEKDKQARKQAKRKRRNRRIYTDAKQQRPKPIFRKSFPKVLGNL
jgi:hypothetical protein